MTKKIGTLKSRGFTYTINNATDDDLAFAMSLYEDDVECKYNIIGSEYASRTGTFHIQGYVYYTNPRYLKSIKKKHSKWHIECQKARMNVNAYCYCMEERDDYEQGERPRQGHRTDLEVIKYDILKKTPMNVIANNYFSQWVYHRKAFDEYSKMNNKYDTKLYIYDNDDLSYSFSVIYKDFNKQADLIITSLFEFDAVQIYQKYYSKEYRNIYVPSGMYVEKISDLVAEVICRNPPTIKDDEHIGIATDDTDKD